MTVAAEILSSMTGFEWACFVIVQFAGTFQLFKWGCAMGSWVAEKVIKRVERTRNVDKPARDVYNHLF